MAAKKRVRRVLSPGELARRITDQWSSVKPGTEVTLDAFDAELHEVNRFQIAAALKELELEGRGRFIVGRKGNRSRFVWGAANDADESAATSIGYPASLEAADQLARVSSSSSEEAASARMLEHMFHVRPDVVVRMTLPEDITAAEIERLCKLLQILPFT